MSRSMIARLCGVALEARTATRTIDPVELAIVSRRIAATVGSIRRARIVVEGAAPIGAHVIGARVTSLNELLAVLASVPALVDGATLPLRWRLALRAIGMPVLDHALGAVLGGALVVAVTKRASEIEVVRAVDGSYRVRINNQTHSARGHRAAGPAIAQTARAAVASQPAWMPAR